MIIITKKEDIATDIINHINEENLNFWCTKNEIKKGIHCVETGKKYTNPRLVSKGTQILIEIGTLKRISQKRFEINHQNMPTF